MRICHTRLSEFWMRYRLNKPLLQWGSATSMVLALALYIYIYARSWHNWQYAFGAQTAAWRGRWLNFCSANPSCIHHLGSTGPYHKTCKELITTVILCPNYSLFGLQLSPSDLINLGLRFRQSLSMVRMLHRIQELDRVRFTTAPITLECYADRRPWGLCMWTIIPGAVIQTARHQSHLLLTSPWVGFSVKLFDSPMVCKIC